MVSELKKIIGAAVTLFLFSCPAVVHAENQASGITKEDIVGASPSTRLANTKKKPKKTPVAKEENHLSEPGARGLIHYKFPLPDSLKPNFEFWKLIYSKYDKNQAVFHDTEHLQVVYSALDFSEPAAPAQEISEDDETELAQASLSKRERISAEKERIRNILLKLAAGGYEEKDLNADERKIYHLFDKIDEADKFAAAAEPGRIRSQTGQKDKFLQAIEWSGAYLTEIEDIFTSYGLPVELTRIVFVESMFNLRARSKVGASGLWQFMPGTGRLYLNINAWMDERNDPIQATHAAARYLKANFETLQSWPLAVNAYNSGTLNLERAKNELGTDDIGVIAKNYRGGGYKFASRNFYTEFLAALEVANHYRNYFGEIKRMPRLRYETFALEESLSLSELAGACGVSLETLQELNPGYHSRVFSSNKPLPAGYSLKIPEGTRVQFEKGAKEVAERHLNGPTKVLAVE